MASSIDSRKSSQAGYLKQLQQNRISNSATKDSSAKDSSSRVLSNSQDTLRSRVDTERETQVQNHSDAAINHISQDRRVEVEEHAVQNKNDSFYKVHERGSRFYENGKSYVIEAYAPKEEKDNIRVTVQNNKAVISGHRQYGDEVRKGNKLTSTNNYQTFREEFSFKTPVASQGMQKERDGDFIRFVIPKQSTQEAPSQDEDEVLG